MKRWITAISLVIVLTLLCSLAACGETGSGTGGTGYDGREYDVSALGDGSVKMTVTKVGTNYRLALTGTGATVDYNKKGDVPWNVVLKMVTDISIGEGVTNVGDYYFYGTNIARLTLPASVEKVGANSFGADTVLYSYAEVEFDTPNTIYYYSEVKPYQNGKYFRLVAGEPKVWDTYSVLFIGNSFTFRQGTEDNPMVPYLFGQLAESLGESVNVDAVVKSSCTLTKYANPQDEMGAKVEEKLTANQYNYIVLQEQSTTPLNNYDAFNTAVAALVKRVGETQRNAKVYLYQTWGSPTGISGTRYTTVAEMSAALDEAYMRAGQANNLPVTHVGNAFADVYTNNPDIALYADDLRHQSNLGAYLSACCHVCGMLGLDVRASEYFDVFDASTCKILQEAAYNASHVK